MVRALIAVILSNYHKLRTSTLFVNSFYLMLATLALAGFGFVFWAVVARGYDTATVGMATTLLSVSGLISMLSLVGFDITFVRFLPKSIRKYDQMNTGFMIVGITSTVFSVICVLSFPFVAPELGFVTRDPWYFAGFVFFTLATSLNTLTNAVFLAFKRARDIFLINMIFSALKVALPLYLINGSAMMIFTLAGIAQVVGLVVSYIVIKATTGYYFSPKVHVDILAVVKKYSLSVYASSILNLLPPTLLPLLVVQQMAHENAAYYYMAFTIASVLYTIAYASMQSAFAEGSHDETAMKSYVMKSIRLTLILLIPAAAIIAMLSNFILGIFGDDYAQHGRALLLVFIASAPFVAAYSCLGAVFKVIRQLRGVIVMNIVYAVVILGASYFMVPRHGLIAIGWAWMLGNVAATGVGFFYLHFRKH